MENKINKVITLNNKSKFLILDQGFIEGKSYFFVSKLDKDNNLTKEFSIFEYITKNGKNKVDVVLDINLLQVLAEYFKNRLQYI